MKHLLLTLFALTLIGCTRLNSAVEQKVSEEVESLIWEGQCWVEANFGTEVIHTTTIEHILISVSGNRVFVSTNTAFRNQKGHFLDLLVLTECNMPSQYIDTIECHILTTAPTPDIEMNKRMIPTPPAEGCKGQE
jgi:hypothetical protein